MIRAFVFITAAFAVSACDLSGRETPPQQNPGVKPTQLELIVGLKPEEYGRYSTTQLTIIKSLQESSYISQGEADRRIKHVKKYRPYGIEF